MTSLIRDGGAPMWAILLFGLVNLIAALRFAYRPTRARLPPIVALALATYLWSLAPAPPPAPRSDAERHGASLFGDRCAGCHAAGEPIAVERVGTDPVAAHSRDRGTGMYRPPSLRGVRDRALLLHDGSVRSLGELLDPARTTGGHRFATSLSAADRSDLVAFLSTL